MFNLKILLISVLAAALLSGAVSGTVIWKNRTNYYTAIILKEHSDIQQKLSVAKTEIIATERKLNNVSSQLEQAYLELRKEQDAHKAALDKYRTERGGLLFKSSSCSKGHASVTTTATSNTSTSSPEASSSCELSRESSEAIAATYEDADEMRARLLIAQKYAQEIEKQREELSKGK